MRSRTSDSSSRAALSEVAVSTTVPEPLAKKLRRLSELECSTIAATTRRLIARSVDSELAAFTGIAGGGR
jgi:hypothetical protein